MVRVIGIAAVVLLAGFASGQTPGEARSYFVQQADSDPVTVIPVVPEGGFVLTRLVGFYQGELWLYEDGEARLRLIADAVNDHHWDTGVVFTAGSTITAVSTGGHVTMSFSGYIPCQPSCLSGSFPVSSAGIGVLVLLVAVGAFHHQRRRDQR